MAYSLCQLAYAGITRWQNLPGVLLRLHRGGSLV